MAGNHKLGAGSALIATGIAGIILSFLMGWNSIPAPWDFMAGFVSGILIGVGAALAIWGLIERRTGSLKTSD